MTRLGTPQKRIRLAQDRIRLDPVGVGEHVGGIEDVEEFLGIARGLSEAVIERAPARAADFVDHAVIDDAALLVLVEAFVEELPQDSGRSAKCPSHRHS